MTRRRATRRTPARRQQHSIGWTILAVFLVMCLFGWIVNEVPAAAGVAGAALVIVLFAAFISHIRH